MRFFIFYKLVEFDIKNMRPEEEFSDALEFYNVNEVKKYAESKSIIRTQEKITKRALEILFEYSAYTQKEKNIHILDVGMGCGFSTDYLNRSGFRATGFDINWLFLNFYAIPKLNPIQADMGHIPFQSNTFDFILSISAAQWILSIKDKMQKKIALGNFSRSLVDLIHPGGAIIIQFYPKSSDQMQELGDSFKPYDEITGGYIIDNQHTPKKRKVFLFLQKKFLRGDNYDS